MELAPKYLSKDYIQHNPNIPTGLKGFTDALGQFLKPVEVHPTIQRPLIAIVAEGDLVVMAFVDSGVNNPAAKKPYTTTAFDMFRVKGGHIVEHWDNAPLMQMPPPN